MSAGADRLRRLAEQAEEVAAYNRDETDDIPSGQAAAIAYSAIQARSIDLARWAADAADVLAEIDESGDWSHRYDFAPLLARLGEITGAAE